MNGQTRQTQGQHKTHTTIYKMDTSRSDLKNKLGPAEWKYFDTKILMKMIIKMTYIKYKDTDIEKLGLP